MYNTIIIGAGPAGMAAALYLERSGLSCLIIDKDAPGGEMLKTDKIENYLGFDNINGADLALKMFKQIKETGVTYVYGKVTGIRKESKFTVTTETDSYQSDHVIIATGKINNKLGLDNEDKVKGISYCAVCDGSFYKNKIVGIVGAGNAAFTEALYLSSLAKQVYIINRSERIRADKIYQTKVKNKENIIYLANAIVTGINEQDNVLTSVIINDKEVLKLDGLFLAIGGKPQVDFINGLEEENGYLLVNEKMETNIKGLYAIGDVIKKDYYQIGTAINDGIVAALSIKEGEI